ncbi:MAG: 30S ribosomal protein S7, partial [Acidimicrobiia bacterium]
MPRKGPAQRREMTHDPVYRSLLVTQLVKKIMLHGKK